MPGDDWMISFFLFAFHLSVYLIACIPPLVNRAACAPHALPANINLSPVTLELRVMCAIQVQAFRLITKLQSHLIRNLLFAPGTYASDTGSFTCTPCPAGTSAANPGKTVCSACSSGKYSVGTVSDRKHVYAF